MLPFDVELRAGEVTGLLGPNGSGKSTFLRMLTGLVRPDRGAASVDGARLRGDGTAVRRRCTYMPGETAMYGELSGAAHLAWFLRGRARAARRRATEIADDLGLPLRKRVRAYSHGMKRQLQLAAALGPDVAVRILDEPTEGLDPTKRAEVLALLAEEATAGATVLLSSHHLAEVDRACARLLFLSEGKLIADENTSALSDRARRLVRITWPDGTDAAALAPRLEALGAAEVHSRGAHASALLEGVEPRVFLAAVAQAGDVPTPTALAYGEHSLRDLYRDLYGVEGV